MRAFDVSLNGEKLCLAGIAENGALSVIISMVNHIPADLSVTASIGLKGESAVLKWVDQEIKVGDQITVKLVTTDDADQPTIEKPWDTAKE